MSARTEELKGKLEKAKALYPRNKMGGLKDDLAEAIHLMLGLVVELHERIDELGSRLARVESWPTSGPND